MATLLDTLLESRENDIGVKFNAINVTSKGVTVGNSDGNNYEISSYLIVSDRDDPTITNPIISNYVMEATKESYYDDLLRISYKKYKSVVDGGEYHKIILIKTVLSTNEIDKTSGITLIKKVFYVEESPEAKSDPRPYELKMAIKQTEDLEDWGILVALRHGIKSFKLNRITGEFLLPDKNGEFSVITRNTSHIYNPSGNYIKDIRFKRLGFMYSSVTNYQTESKIYNIEISTPAEMVGESSPLLKAIIKNRDHGIVAINRTFLSDLIFSDLFDSDNGEVKHLLALGDPDYVDVRTNRTDIETERIFNSADFNKGSYLDYINSGRMTALIVKDFKDMDKVIKFANTNIIIYISNQKHNNLLSFNEEIKNIFGKDYDKFMRNLVYYGDLHTKEEILFTPNAVITDEEVKLKNVEMKEKNELVNDLVELLNKKKISRIEIGIRKIMFQEIIEEDGKLKSVRRVNNFLAPSQKVIKSFIEGDLKEFSRYNMYLGEHECRITTYSDKKVEVIPIKKPNPKLRRSNEIYFDLDKGKVSEFMSNQYIHIYGKNEQLRNAVIKSLVAIAAKGKSIIVYDRSYLYTEDDFNYQYNIIVTRKTPEELPIYNDFDFIVIPEFDNEELILSNPNSKIISGGFIEKKFDSIRVMNYSADGGASE